MGLLMKQAVARIDKRTTVVCLHAAGMIRELDEPFDTLNGSFDAPPFHLHCRTVVRAYLRGFVSGQRNAANKELMTRPLADRRFTGIDNYTKRLPQPKTRARVRAEDLLRDLQTSKEVIGDAGPTATRLKLASGRRVISKTVSQDAAEREVLASIVADATEASVPVTIRTSATDVVFEEFPGTIGAVLMGRGNSLRSDLIYSKTVTGKRLGLLDILLGNIGRHNFSWYLYESKVFGIDHSLIFNWDRQRNQGLVGTFGFQWVMRDAATGRVKRYKALLHPEDVPVLRRRLNNIRVEFQRLNRDREWRTMMDVFEKLAKAATARDRLLGDD